MKKIVLYIVYLFVVSSNAFSQEFTAKAHMDTNTFLIGDQVSLKLQVTFPSSYTISWPDLRDTITGKIEIIKKYKIDTVINADRKTLTQRLVVTSFDSGYHALPPISFKFTKAGDTTQYEVRTQELMLAVSTIAVDTTKSIKDIKAPIRVPITFKEIAPFVLGAIVFGALIVLIIYYLRRKKKNLPLFSLRSKPKLPPHEQALLDIEALRQRKLWQQGKIKDYYTELTDIVRRYIEERFTIRAIEMTTDEIICSFEEYIGFDRTLIAELKQMLELADLVKFAKALPLPLEHDQSLNNAVHFVNATVPAKDENELNKNKE